MKKYGLLAIFLAMGILAMAAPAGATTVDLPFTEGVPHLGAKNICLPNPLGGEICVPDQ